MDIVIGSWKKTSHKVTEVVDQNTIQLSLLSGAYEVKPEEAPTQIFHYSHVIDLL